MFILDTNVLSAMMHPGRVPELAAWIERQEEGRLFTTAMSHAEIFSGLTIMADGRRRRDLERMAREMFEEFEGRILSFDTNAANAYAELFALGRRGGRPVATIDLMIASIAQAQGACMVTRNAGDFEGCGLTLINPWKDTWLRRPLE